MTHDSVISLENWPIYCPGGYLKEAVHFIKTTQKILRRNVSTKNFSMSLANGIAGELLFLRQLFNLNPTVELKFHIEQQANFALQRLTFSEPFLSHTGEIGLLFSIDILADIFVDRLYVKNLYDRLDEAISSTLNDGSIPAIDLIDGLVGLGFYVIKRRNIPIDHTLLSCIIRKILECASSDQGHISWTTNKANSGSVHDIGLAHGIPGILAFFCDVYALNNKAEFLRPIIEDIIDWIVLHYDQNQSNVRSAFPYISEERLSSRLGWCYGDLSVATALTKAVIALDDEHLHRFTHSLILRTTYREASSTHVDTNGLCHGRLGLAHVYARLGAYYNDMRIRGAARYWLENFLSIYSQLGPVGFEGLGYLEGLCGGGLVVASSITNAAPTWDAMLSMDLPITPV